MKLNAHFVLKCVFLTLQKVEKSTNRPHLRTKKRMANFKFMCVALLLCANTSSIAQNYVPAGLDPNGIVLWLNASHFTSGIWRDSSSFSNNAALFGPTFHLSNAPNGRPAFYFDGVDDYALVSESSSLILDTLSLSVWCYPEQISNGSGIVQTILTRGADEIYHNYRLVLNESRIASVGMYHNTFNSFIFSSINAFYPDFMYVKSQTQSSYDKWENINIQSSSIFPSFSVYEKILYRNNMLESNSALAPYLPYTGTGDLLIGAQPDGNGGTQDFFKGYIGEIILYNRVLNGSERALLYAYGKANRNDHSNNTIFDVNAAGIYYQELIGIGKAAGEPALNSSHSSSGGLILRSYDGLFADNSWVVIATNLVSADSLQSWGAGDRWGRGWRVESNIATSDSIRMALSFSGMGKSSAPSTSTHHFLMRASNETFTNNQEYIPCRVERAHTDTLEITVKSSDLTDGFYTMVTTPNTTTSPLTWSGNSNSYWGNPSNWDGGVVPSTFNFPLVVQNGANPLVLPAGSYTIDSIISEQNSTLELSAGSEAICQHVRIDGNLIIRANSSEYAQIKAQDFSGNGNLLRETYIPSNGWHNVGLCLDADATASQFGQVSSSLGNLFIWGNNGWEVVQSSDFNDPGRGYLAFTGTNGTQNQPGIWTTNASLSDVNTSISNRVLMYSDNGTIDDSDWNLLCNPFTCAINFFNLPWSGVANSFAIWNPATNMYEYTSSEFLGNNGGKIAPGQGFWVRAESSTANTGNWNMEDHGSTSTTPTFLKSEREWVKIHIQQESDSMKRDFVTLVNVPGASPELESSMDAIQRSHGSQMPLIYHNSNQDKLAISCLDFNDWVGGLSLELFVPQAGVYKIYTERSDSTMNRNFVLEVPMENSWNSITTSDYILNVADSGTVIPINLHLNPNLDIPTAADPNTDVSVNLWVEKDFWGINIPGGAVRTTVHVCDVKGRVQGSYELEGDMRIPNHSLPPGIYFIHLNVDGRAYQLKTIKR